MKIITLEKSNPRTLSWAGGELIDWSEGTIYRAEGNKRGGYTLSFDCDGAITSEDGTYAFVYKKLGTKGVLLKNGKIIREVNRTFYHSNTYEYPAAFATLGGKTYLIHCPEEYCQLDFEDVETGEIVTKIPDRAPVDFFHSRLEVSPDNKFLLSKGWVWHPLDTVRLFDIEACLSNPHLLDHREKSSPDSSAEISSASFIDNDRILLCTSSEEPLSEEDEILQPSSVGIWNFKEDVISNVVSAKDAKNVFAIDENHCWDLYEYPKIIDLTTGEIVDKAEDIDSGKQASSIIRHLKDLPKIAFNPKTKELAISGDGKVFILSKA